MAIFTTLPQAAQYIRKHHGRFAGRSATHTLEVLANLKAEIESSKCGLCGATYKAMIDPELTDYNIIWTYIYIKRHKNGAWEVLEATTPQDWWCDI